MIDLVLTTVVISLSGALSPGPLTASTMAIGINGGWRGGFKVALGHTVAEFPYVILLAFLMGSVKYYLDMPLIKMPMSITISIFIGYFAYLLLLDALKGPSSSSSGFRKTISANPITVGIVLTAFNPYFLLWWATVGLPLINMSLALGVFSGIIVMYVSHVWLDYAWLSLIAHVPYSGASLFGGKLYRIILIILCVILIVFAIEILYETFLA